MMGLISGSWNFFRIIFNTKDLIAKKDLNWKDLFKIQNSFKNKVIVTKKKIIFLGYILFENIKV